MVFCKPTSKGFSKTRNFLVLFYCGQPLFDHLRFVFFLNSHKSDFQFTSIYPGSLSLLVVRFSKAFCFSASSSSFFKIAEKKNPRWESNHRPLARQSNYNTIRSQPPTNQSHSLSGRSSDATCKNPSESDIIFFRKNLL